MMNVYVRTIMIATRLDEPARLDARPRSRRPAWVSRLLGRPRE